MMIVFVVFAISANNLYGQSGSGCQIQCPAGAVCGCIDCTPCNSGTFQNLCVCRPSANVSCSVQSGNCLSRECAGCTSRAGGQVCRTYSGCPGMSCAINDCQGSQGAANAGFECTACSRRAFPSLGLAGASDSGKIRVSFVENTNLPIEITDFRWEAKDGEFRSDGIRIKNKQGSGLITLDIRIRYRAGKDRMETTMRIDSWEADEPFVGALAESEPAVSVARVVRHPQLDTVELLPVYAEFEDGTKIAADGSIRPCAALQASREAIQRAWQDLEKLIASQAPIEEIEKELRDRSELDGIRSRFAGPERLRLMVVHLQKARRLAP